MTGGQAKIMRGVRRWDSLVPEASSMTRRSTPSRHFSATRVSDALVPDLLSHERPRYRLTRRRDAPATNVR